MQTDTTAPLPETERLSRTGLVIRILVGLLVTVAMIAGTWAEDDHFPFGPMKMYSSSHGLDEPVEDTRVEAVNAEGERFKLTQANTGFRRAEVEGQMPRFRADPDLLRSLARAYEKRRPTRPGIVRVEIVVRWWEMDDGRVNGDYTEETVVTWVRDGGSR